MSVSYISQKCPSCGSTKFKYLKNIKMWECLYCGTQIERHEQADSLFTIKNVVRQTLIDLSYRRFSEAKNNLVECEKIDSRYVGTTIAKICYLLNSLLYTNISQQEKQNHINQINKYYGELCENGEEPSEEEVILYEFLDSAEAYGLLILVFDTLNANKRLDTIFDFFKPEEVYSLNLNSSLLKYMVNHNHLETADKIVENIDNIEKRSALLFLLSNYPDGEQKAKNCNLIISKNTLSCDEAYIIEDYLNNSSDTIGTKFEIACSSLSCDAKPSIKCLMQSIIPKLDNTDDIAKLFGIIMSKKLVDTEIYTIIDYSLEKCSQNIILYVFEMLKNTHQFVVLNQQHFISLFNNTSVNYEYKRKILETAINFNVNNKTKEQFISYYLNNISAEKQDREAFLEYLFTLIPSLSTVSIENYIIKCTLDGENKPKIVERIFKLEINRSFFRETLDKYINLNSDSPDVSDKIINILSDNGLKMNENTIVSFLLNPNRSEEIKLKILQKAINSNIRYLNVLDKYLINVSKAVFSERIFQELLNYSDSVSVDSCIKYLLYINDSEASKPINSKKLLEKCKIPILTNHCCIRIFNDSIECNVLQAYLIITPDSPDLTCSVIDSIGGKQIKINTEIIISGEKKKFKKYIQSVRDRLSNSSIAAAKDLNLL